MPKFIICLLLTLFGAGTLLGEVPTKISFEPIVSTEELVDGMEFYLYTDINGAGSEASASTALVGFINNNSNIRFTDVQDGKEQVFSLLKMNDKWVISNGTGKFLSYETIDALAKMDKVTSDVFTPDNFTASQLLQISFDVDGCVHISPEYNNQAALYVVDESDESAKLYRAYFKASDESLYTGLRIGRNKITLLKNPPVITVKDGWDVSVSSPDGCEVLYKIVPMASGDADRSARRVTGDEWKTWNETNWIADRDAIMEDHIFMAKCREGDLESETVSTVIKSMVLTSISDNSISVPESDNRPIFHNLHGLPVDSSALVPGQLYIRLDNSGKAGLYLHR